MSFDQIKAEALLLPVSERVELAEALWTSVDLDRSAFEINSGYRI